MGNNTCPENQKRRGVGISRHRVRSKVFDHRNVGRAVSGSRIEDVGIADAAGLHVFEFVSGDRHSSIGKLSGTAAGQINAPPVTAWGRSARYNVAARIDKRPVETMRVQDRECRVGGVSFCNAAEIKAGACKAEADVLITPPDMAAPHGRRIEIDGLIPDGRTGGGQFNAVRQRVSADGTPPDPGQLAYGHVKRTIRGLRDLLRAPEHRPKIVRYAYERILPGGVGEPIELAFRQIIAEMGVERIHPRERGAGRLLGYQRIGCIQNDPEQRPHVGGFEFETLGILLDAQCRSVSVRLTCRQEGKAGEEHGCERTGQSAAPHSPHTITDTPGTGTG